MKEMDASVKIYKFRFTPLMIAVLITGIVLCCVCFGLSTWQFIGFLQHGALGTLLEWIKYFILFFVSIFLAIIFISMLARSYYKLTDQQLITVFGIIKSKYELKKIRSVCLLNGSKKLNLYFDDFKTKYMTIVVKEEWYDDFIQNITARNERIEFDFSSAEDEMNGKNKK